jgi:hypothetical protein
MFLEILDVATASQAERLWRVAALAGLGMTWDSRARLRFVRNNRRRMWGEAG